MDSTTKVFGSRHEMSVGGGKQRWAAEREKARKKRPAAVPTLSPIQCGARGRSEGTVLHSRPGMQPPNPKNPTLRHRAPETPTPRLEAVLPSDQGTKSEPVHDTRLTENRQNTSQLGTHSA